MATQFANAAVIDSETMQQAIGRPVPSFDNDPMPDEAPPTAARGIVTAMVIASPFWVLVACTVYMLV